MTEDPNQPTVTPGGRLFQSIVGGVWVLMLLIVIVASLFPVAGRNRQRQLGEEANRNLDLLFQAKEAYSREARVDWSKPLPDNLVNLPPEALTRFLPKESRNLDWSARGDYSLGPLIGENGEVVVPIHHSEAHDPDGNGLTNAAEGLFIHRRSHLQDPENGLWFRDPAFLFPK